MSNIGDERGQIACTLEMPFSEQAYCTAHSPSLALPTPRPDESFWLMLVGIVTWMPFCAGTIAGAEVALCNEPAREVRHPANRAACMRNTAQDTACRE